jgi:Tfp pilus assembly protein PilF
MAFATDPRALALNNQGADLFGQGKFLEAKALFEAIW